MSELLQKSESYTVHRWKLLTGVSALALTVYGSSTALAEAEEADRPTVWIELGGQMEIQQGLSKPFASNFMNKSPTPDVYEGFPFIDDQRESPFSIGEEGKISFQPKESDWRFTAGIRYGRSHSNRHSHRQGPEHSPIPFSIFGSAYTKYFSSIPLADTNTQNRQEHLIVDFAAGKDVGLGLFGHGGSSVINVGVRFASFTSSTAAYITGRPSIGVAYAPVFYGKYFIPRPTFYQYAMSARATRSFHGIGPTISWDASAQLAGNESDGELTVDWGVNAALLFGRQKAKVDQSTAVHHLFITANGYATYIPSYPAPHHAIRSRHVVVPNVGGFAGVSIRYTNVKVSLGYRADFFFGAMDTGVDSQRSQNVGFHGPFATMSVGLGG